MTGRGDGTTVISAHMIGASEVIIGAIGVARGRASVTVFSSDGLGNSGAALITIFSDIVSTETGVFGISITGERTLAER